MNNLWNGPIRTLAALLGDSPGAQAYNANAVPTGVFFTYQPGGTAGAGIYTTWAAVYAAAAAVAYLCPTIVVDASRGTPTVTAGTWDISNMTILGNGAFPTLEIADGGHFTGDGYWFSNLELNSKATSAAVVTVSTSVLVTLENGAIIGTDATSTKPFFSSAAGGSLLLTMGIQGELAGFAAAPVISTAAGGTAQVVAGQFSVISANALSGSGVITVDLLDASVTLSATQTGLSNEVVLQGPTNAKPALSLSAAGGAQALPARPTVLAAPTPSWFLATPSGNQAGATTYTLQVAGAYQPLDIVRILFTKTQLNGANVNVVDGGAGTPTLGIIIAANVGASGSGFVDAQLNAAGTHWTLLGAGSQ